MINFKFLVSEGMIDAKDLKLAINVLVKHNGYDEKAMTVMGGLLTRLIHLQGPLK